MQQAILGDAAAFPSVAAAAAAGWWRGREAAAGLAFAPFAPLDASVFGLSSQSCKTCCPALSTSWAPTTWPTSRSSPRPTREARPRLLKTSGLQALPSVPPPPPPPVLFEGPGLTILQSGTP